MQFCSPATQPNVTQVRAAWRAYVERGILDAVRVRPHVLRAWERSRRGGCNPYQPRADVLPSAETVALLRQEARLIEIATPFMIALSRAAAGERHATMLADGNGRVLKVIGDEATVADENFPRAGALLSEATAGANGLGTPLAESGYIELVGPEHFIEGFQVFTCQGVPLLTSASTHAGVLGISVRRLETATKLRDILFCASEAAECELLSAWLSDEVLSEGALEPALEKLRQDMVQRITMARLQLEIAARQIAAGADASTAIRAAQQLSQKFRRQAAVWRNLVGDAASMPEPILLADLVEDFVDLLETEARVARVQLVWGQVDHVLVLDDVRALSQRLLGCFLTVMHRAMKESEVRVDVVISEDRGTVGLSSIFPTGESLTYSVTATVLKS